AEASASFMPSLKPLTAPPRSEPMLRSFLVPNTSRTMTSTMSQCQMLNEPIPLSSILQHGRQGIGPAQDVKVQMIHFLQPDPSGVDNGSEPIFAALFPRDLRGGHHQPAHRGFVPRLEFGHRADVLLRHHQDVNRRYRR